MKFYDLKNSPNTRRVRIFMAEKGVTADSVDIDMAKGENRTPEFLAMNPLGKMPVLELDDGTIIAESVAICRYLEEMHPEPPMFGRDTMERTNVEMWNRRMELEVLQPIMLTFVHSHPMWKGIYKQFEDFGEDCRVRALERLEWLNGELEGREYLATGDYTVADITAQCAVLMGKAVNVRAAPEWSHLNAWWERVAARPTARA